MTERSYTYWSAISDQAIAQRIGHYIKHHRLLQNKTQDQTAHEASISRSTLSLLERGEAVSLSTLLQVLRVLGQLHVLEAFTIEDTISPMALVREAKLKRKRARGSNYEDKDEPTW